MKQETNKSLSAKEIVDIMDDKRQWMVIKNHPKGISITLPNQSNYIATVTEQSTQGIMDYHSTPVPEKTMANAAAICNAVNGTYLKGYDPEAMEELVKRLQMMVDYSKKVIQYPKGSKGYDPIDEINLSNTIEKSESALSKAIIK